MAKIIFLVAYLISAFGGSSTSTDIECSYGMPYTWPVVGDIYSCLVNNNPNILTQESAQISGISGSHGSLKGNDDVLGFWARYKKIQYFPQGLEKIFKNLKAIRILISQLKEIHQVDLKPFPNLVHFSLYENAIEVIEEGLFDFNPVLELVQFYENKIIHIDSNVFDNLSKLSYFWFKFVPCVKKDIFNSISQVKEAIKVVKTNCTNSEFLSLDEQIKNLEIESKTLNLTDFNVKLESFEKSFKNSKFSKFRPLNYKFENLKLTVNSSKSAQIINTSVISEESDNKTCVLSCDFNNINDKLEDLKLTQCGLKSPFDELKTSQNALQTTLSGIKSSITDHGSKIDQIQNSQNQIKDSMTSSINSVSGKVNDFSQTQNGMKNSISQIEVKVNDLKSSQDETKLSISDIVTTLSDHKTLQNEFKDSLIKVRTMQNEVKVSLNDIKNNKNDNFDNKLAAFDEKLETFEGKFENLEGHFMEFEVKMAEKLEKIEKENANSRHKISMNFDEKIKGIEKRLMKKFEEILEEKLEKFLDKKLGNVIEARLGTE